jgi:polysaccharide export outer membrane protein
MTWYNPQFTQFCIHRYMRAPLSKKSVLLTGFIFFSAVSACFGENSSNPARLRYVESAEAAADNPSMLNSGALLNSSNPVSAQAAYVLPSSMTETANIASTDSTSTDYVLDTQDMLTISVLQPDPFTVELTVAPDGTITFPYIGTVSVKGQTLMQTQEKIQTGLMDYMKYPVVSVSLRQSKSLTFFVFGEVQRPGSYILEKDTTVLKAITTAGGFTRVAATDNVKVVRQLADGTTSALNVDVGGLMNGRSTKDEKIERGDVITVSKSFF